MNQTGTVFVTGADRGLGLALCARLLEQGWQVFAGQYMPDWHELPALQSQYPRTLYRIPLDVRSEESCTVAAQAVTAITDHLDVLINNAGVYSPTAGGTIREPQDYASMHHMYDVNALGPLRVVQAFLPLTDRSALKRLCFVSSEAGSVTRAQRTAWFGYCMSKAALNMGARILFNDLYSQGYTFRVYHPGWVRTYITGEINREATLEPAEAAASAIPIFLNPEEDEGRLALIDYEGNIWPW